MSNNNLTPKNIFRNISDRRNAERRNTERRNSNRRTSNQRKSVRYAKSNLTAHLILKQTFKSNQYTYAKVVDISSTGARIDTAQKLSVKTNVVLNIMLDNQYTHKIKAKVTRICQNATSGINYGLTFDEAQHALIDHLIVNNNDFSIT
jgi:preprotein translocase subunit SecD